MACGSRGFSAPVAGPIVQGPYTGPGTSHFGVNAVDISAPDGTAVAAAVPGRVIVAVGGRPDVPSLTDYEAAGPFGSGRYGNFVVQLGDDGCPYLYAHMRDTAVSIGQHVGMGELLGHVGQSGHATGPHVHFQTISTQRIDALMAAGGPAPKSPHPSLLSDVLSVSPLGGLHIPNPFGFVTDTASTLARFFTFDLPNYLKVFGGAMIMTIGLLVALAAVGFSSGAVGPEIEQIPVVGGYAKAARAKKGARKSAAAAEKSQNVKVQRLAETENVRTEAQAERAYKTTRARRLASEGMTREGGFDE